MFHWCSLICEKTLWGHPGRSSFEVWQPWISPPIEKIQWVGSFHFMTHRPDHKFFTSPATETSPGPSSLPHKGPIHHIFTLWLKCDVVMVWLAKYGVKTSNCFRVAALRLPSLFKPTPQTGTPTLSRPYCYDSVGLANPSVTSSTCPSAANMCLHTYIECLPGFFPQRLHSCAGRALEGQYGGRAGRSTVVTAL